jgi:GTP cyclohydrolase IB
MASTTPANGVIPDVQSSADTRRIAIDKVGVKSVTYPITLRTKDGGEQSTVASIDMYVSLPHHQKGTHMSRFLEVLNTHARPLSPECMMDVAKAMRERLEAETAHLSIQTTYFIEKEAPVTRARGMMDYSVTFEATSNGEEDLILRVRAPATSLCPCSKEISDYGAHNQRCEIEAAVRFDGTVWIEDLVEHLEKAASCPVYSVLKRPDEKYVTEAAHDNPKFVEDIVRDLAGALKNDERVTWFEVSSENFESIHSHNAYAQIIVDKREG